MSKTSRPAMTSEQRRVYAERVKLLRQAAGMRQEDLAEAAGVSRPTIIGIENGATIPQQDKLVKILSVLGVDVDGPKFSDQTELWLSMMGALIEAIPDARREPAVNAAIRELTAGVRTANVSASIETPSPKSDRELRDELEERRERRKPRDRDQIAAEDQDKEPTDDRTT